MGPLTEFSKVGMDQIFLTNREYYDKTDLFPKNRCKIPIFSFAHSDWVWVDAEKVMKKSLPPSDTRS